MNKVISFIIVLVVCGCARSNTNKNGAVNVPDAFELPQIPAIYESAYDQGVWMSEHYWDKFDFADLRYINNEDITEQAYANYIALINNAPGEIGTSSLKSMLSKAEAEPAMLEYFAELGEKYLYEPNSPMRNEELYISQLEFVLASDKVDDLEKIRPRAHYNMALKNRVGTKAGDFSFTLASGRKMDLYDVKEDYILLYFNNPDCTACAELTRDIQASNMIMPLVRTGKMKVVAVYPDEDLTAWRDHITDFPEDWLNGYDAEQVLRKEQLYDLKAIPTLYLLDSERKVLVKDAGMAYTVEAYLHNIGY